MLRGFVKGRGDRPSQGPRTSIGKRSAPGFCFLVPSDNTGVRLPILECLWVLAGLEFQVAQFVMSTEVRPGVEDKLSLPLQPDSQRRKRRQADVIVVRIERLRTLVLLHAFFVAT